MKPLSSLALGALLALVITLSLPVAHADDPLQSAIACCDDADVPSSCSVAPTPSDLSACDPEAEPALCELVDGFPEGTCQEVVLQCCPTDIVQNGVMWIDWCRDYAPGQICGDGPVTAQLLP